MKKLLLTCAMAVLAFAGNAETKTYTDQLMVTVNEESTTQESTVTVEELEDGYINFALNNFVLKNGEDNMYVGNIEISNLFLSDKGDYKSFSYNANLKIKAGNIEGIGEDQWVGPELGNVPLVLKGKIANGKLYVTIDIDMQESLKQTIYVKFGTDFSPSTVLETKQCSALLELEANGEAYESKTYTTDLSVFSNGDVCIKLPNIQMYSNGELVDLMGTMNIDDVSVLDRENNGEKYQQLFFNGYANFVAGDVEGIDPSWWGFQGLSIPASLSGTIKDGILYYVVKLTYNKNSFVLTFGVNPVEIKNVGDAKTYADNIVVTVNEESTEPIPADVIVEPLTNGGINFNLKNFIMTLNGDQMYVGNIAIEDLKLYEGAGYQYFNYNDNLLIQKGDKEGVAENDWVGPELGEIPLRMMGRITDGKLYVTIDIDMVSLDQIIHVVFGSEITPETGVQSISNTTPASTAIYNLAGQRVAKATKGIYIINGKKVLK